MIKISGNIDKSDTLKRFNSDISFFILRISSDKIKNEILLLLLHIDNNHIFYAGLSKSQ